MKDKVISLLSLIQKAGKLCLSKDILNNFKFKKIHFVFIASDASEKTKERYLKKCHYYSCPYSLNYDSATLSKAIGKFNVMTIGILDEGFTKLILKEGGDYGQTSKE